MVEAAVIFPLVIMTVIAVVFMLIFMFHEVTAQARIQVAVNAEMGRKTETVFAYRNVPQKVSPYMGTRNFHPCWIADEQLRFNRKGLLSRSFTKKKESTAYDVNEKRYIRIVDFVK